MRVTWGGETHMPFELISYSRAVIVTLGESLTNEIWTKEVSL
jgi:hypothetical protein